MWPFSNKREAQLNQRESDLNKLTVELNDYRSQLVEAENNLKKKNDSFKERQENFGLKEKMFAEREMRADNIIAGEKEADRKRQENQEEENRLQKRADGIVADRQEIENEKAELDKRRQAILVAELKRDAGFADERAAFDLELQEKRGKMESEIDAMREQKLAKLTGELATFKIKRLEDITKAEQAVSDRIKAEIAYEREVWRKQQQDERKSLEAERTVFQKQKGAASALQSQLEGRKTELEANERSLERKGQRLEQQWNKKDNELDGKLCALLEEERKSLEIQKESFKNENDRLRESLRIQIELVGAFDLLKRQLNDKDPAEVILELNSKTDKLKRLHEELATRPTEEMREKFRTIDSESQRQKARIEELEKQINYNASMIAETAELRRSNSELDAENKSLAQKASIYEGAANEAQAELSRLRAAYERPAEVAERYKEIEIPHIKADKAKRPTKADIDELIWLKGISNACTYFGLHFNPRILKAFHTALKIADWSQLTVLAGVSGTGKSELPRLYSHFGGLMFEPLSVQPNWDSQESMLGFFNSIDNKFDAQPVLHFLAQSQKKWIDKTNENEGYPGLEDAVCLVLLDEMNLAHPELYFAEFLSKLELRRAMKGMDVPFLPVKIGAGMPPYQLPLGRNVLWTGTMNQDETTKSLSDKVLDRSIIIHFPRPTKLHRRIEQTVLNEKNRGPLLHRDSWQNWCVRKTSLTEDDVKLFKNFIENMSAALAVVGRAIGHRVWQSVEYYMANYPDVRAAKRDGDKDALDNGLHIAFEDQLVQKVMPKLRGIDTRGNSKSKCLDKILTQLNTGIGGKSFNLAEDFNLACELGYGQFIWQSANYLKDELPPANDDDVKPDEEQGDKSHLERANK